MTQTDAKVVGSTGSNYNRIELDGLQITVTRSVTVDEAKFPNECVKVTIQSDGMRNTIILPPDAASDLCELVQGISDEITA